jgi:serine protease inhibitor
MDPTTKLNIANSLWYKEGYPLKADFLKLNTDYFNAEVRSLDFEKAWAVDTINNWCARKTNQLIPKVLNEISRDAAAFLINAVYFKGIWRKKFDKKNTEEALFTDEKGQQLKRHRQPAKTHRQTAITHNNLQVTIQNRQHQIRQSHLSRLKVSPRSRKHQKMSMLHRDGYFMAVRLEMA